jgi:cob(I)alamin adenosyltransferase
MKIYTKGGDQGQTSLIGGNRVLKSHPRLEAYGTVDELSSYIGSIHYELKEDEQASTLAQIQDRLFTIGSSLAADTNSKMKLPELKESDVEHLEKQIDAMNESLPDLKYFILPGGPTPVSTCHIARCVCRRAERNVVNLLDGEAISEVLLKYLNRLSDYLFVLARKVASDKGFEETPWIPEV